MKEIVLGKNRNGMAVLLLTILLYVASAFGLFFGMVVENLLLVILCGLWICLGWILFLGLKV